MKAVPLSNPPNRLSSSNTSCWWYCCPLLSLSLSGSHTGSAYTVCERKWGADIYVPPRGIVLRGGETQAWMYILRLEEQRLDRCWSVKELHEGKERKPELTYCKYEGFFCPFSSFCNSVLLLRLQSCASPLSLCACRTREKKACGRDIGVALHAETFVRATAEFNTDLQVNVFGKWSTWKGFSLSFRNSTGQLLQHCKQEQLRDRPSSDIYFSPVWPYIAQHDHSEETSVGFCCCFDFFLCVFLLIFMTLIQILHVSLVVICG